ncbi:uncharacterized [Tachysurus ichikawai]
MLWARLLPRQRNFNRLPLLRRHQKLVKLSQQPLGQHGEQAMNSKEVRQRGEAWQDGSKVTSGAARAPVTFKFQRRREREGGKAHSPQHALVSTAIPQLSVCQDATLDTRQDAAFTGDESVVQEPLLKSYSLSFCFAFPELWVARAKRKGLRPSTHVRSAPCFSIP